MQVVNLTPIVGLPQFDGWSQVTFDQSKQFVCVFAISGSNAGNVGRDLVDFLDQIKPNSAAELHQLLQQIVDQVNQKGCRLSLAAGVFADQICYLGTFQASICLKRHDKVGQLVYSDVNIKIIEGQLRLGDVFVLVTDLGRSFLEEIQQKLIQGYDVDTIITSVVPSLHSSAHSALSAVAFGVVSDRLLPAETEATESSANIEMVTDFDLGLESNIEPVAETSEPVTATELAVNSALNNPVAYDSVLTYSGAPIKKKSALVGLMGLLIGLLKKLFQVAGRGIMAIKTGVIGLTSRDVYVHQPDKRKVARLAVLIALVLVFVSGIAGFLMYRTNQQHQQAELALQPIQAKLDQAKTLVATDPIAARRQTEQAILEMQTLADSLAQQKAAQKSVLDKLTAAKQYYDSISGREEFRELPTFFDLRLAKPNFIASKVIFTAPNAYFLDIGLAEIVVLNTSNKEVSTISIKPELAIKDLTLVGKNLFLLGNGLYKVKVGETEVTKVKDADEVTKEPGLIASFGDFLYVLSPVKKNIYRYEQTDGKYGEPKSWLKIQPDLDFSKILSWAIDGEVWLTSTEGKLYRFRTGKLSDFPVVGLPEEFNSSVMVFGTAESKNVYLLEAKKHRLVVLDKDGKFVKEIKSGSLAAATNLIVDEAVNQAYVVSGSLVFSIGL